MNITPSNLSPSLPSPEPQETANSHPSFAQVVFNLPVDEKFTYTIPDHFLGSVEVGMRVLVPFGRRTLTGYVIELCERFDKDIPLKAIAELPDTLAVVSAELLALTRWVAGYYHASWGEAIKAALPAGLNEESRETFSLTDQGHQALETEKPGEPARALLETIKRKGPLTAKQIERALPGRFNAHLLRQLRKNQWLSAEIKIQRSTTAVRHERFARLDSTQPDAESLLKRSPKQQRVYELLRDAGGECSLKTLNESIPNSSAPLRELAKKGLVTVETRKVEKTSKPGASPVASADLQEEPVVLNDDQNKALTAICQGLEAKTFNTFLLRGATGSGKTEVYIRAIQHALKLGKTALMMVPEISLTPQTINRFQSRFGNQVAILHSGLSNQERYLEWKKIRDRQVSIVVGTRSSVFAPCHDLGLILIDEEHDASYKQETSPRYHARDTAIVRAKALNATVVLGSATPSLESRTNAENGKYRLLTMNQRVGQRLLPMVHRVDMRQEMDEKKNFSILSIPLSQAIHDRLSRKEQIFLYLNRRGTASFIFCRECGYAFHCSRCSVTLTYHERNRIVCCHYCNQTRRVPEACAECSGSMIRYRGFGTQKLEAEVSKRFPEARVVRMDRDTTRTHADYADVFEKMRDREIDILVGTQMITKGHDFANVTLVGVINADLPLNIPSFRSTELAFQQLTQVAGRAGRGEVPGDVFIQTHNPDHPIFQFVERHDYEKFFEFESNFRQRLHYPPFSKLIALEVESPDQRAGQQFIGNLQSILHRQLRNRRGIELLGPCRASIFQVNNRYRWHFILRAKTVGPLQEILSRCEEIRQLRNSSRVKLTINVDPVDLN